MEVYVHNLNDKKISRNRARMGSVTQPDSSKLDYEESNQSGLPDINN
jgi:hypothetical protein